MRLMIRPAAAKRAAQEHAKTNEAAKPFATAELSYVSITGGAFLSTLNLTRIRVSMHGL